MEVENRKTGIAYCRKSIIVKGMSDEQSVNYQQEAINRYAKQHNITIIKQYSDVGYSGKNTDRPELQMMLEDLNSGEEQVDYLLFYSVDRLGRDLEGNIGTFLKITEYVEIVASVSEHLTNDVEYFKTFFLLLTSHAQTEREHLLLRMADGRKAKIINRKSFNGSYLPLGYVKSLSDNKERLVPANQNNTDDFAAIQELQMVHEIFYGYLQGMSLRKIAERLHQYYGLTRRQTKWTHKSVRYVLSNPAYIGKMNGVLRNSESYYIEDANIEPIVDSLLFAVVQRSLRFEQQGRRRALAAGLPLYNLCLSCATPIVRKGEFIMCPNCKKSAEARTLNQVLAESFIRVLARRGIDKFEKDLVELVTCYEWKRKKLLRWLSQLNDRYETIQRMNDYKNHVGKEKMILANTKESTKTRKELEWIETVINAFKAERLKDRDFSYLLLSTRLIKLSYVVFIDLEAKEIEVMFHRDLMKGGRQNE